MINRSNLKVLRIMDFFQVMNLVKDYLKEEDKSALKLETSVAEFERAFSELDDALKQSTTILATKELSKADEQRSKTLTGLGQMLRALTNSPQEEQAKKAEKLLAEVEKYGKRLSNLPLREESAVIINLLQDFEISENKQAIQSLHLTEWVTLLEQQNTAFDNLYKERSETQSIIQVGKTKEARMVMQKAFDILVKTINANAFLNGGDAYQSLAGKINQEVSRSLAEAKARQTKKEKTISNGMESPNKNNEEETMPNDKEQSI